MLSLALVSVGTMSHSGGASPLPVFLDDSYKRCANDTCVYVTRPGDAGKKMVPIKKGDSWQTFLNTCSVRLDMEVSKVFNSHDEIKRVANLVQGDILFVKIVSHEATSPLQIQGRGRRMLNWIRVVRLSLLQCIAGYIVTEAVKQSKFCETLRVSCPPP